MAQYNNIYDILKQFELQVVKGNHYTKTQADQKFAQSVTELNQLVALLRNDAPGVISKEVDGSAGNFIKLDNTFAHTTYVDNKVTEEVGKIVKGAPELLDTLAEVSKALNDDPSFYQTMKNMIDTKADKTSLSNYQPKTPLLTSLIGNLAGTQTGLLRIQSTGSPEGNIVSIDSNNYLVANDLASYAKSADVYTKTQADGTFAKASALNDYQRTDVMLNNLLSAVKGSKSGLLKVEVSSSGDNVVGVDNTAYATVANMTITDEQLQTLID